MDFSAPQFHPGSGGIVSTPRFLNLSEPFCSLILLSVSGKPLEWLPG